MTGPRDVLELTTEGAIPQYDEAPVGYERVMEFRFQRGWIDRLLSWPWKPLASHRIYRGRCRVVRSEPDENGEMLIEWEGDGSVTERLGR